MQPLSILGRHSVPSLQPRAPTSSRKAISNLKNAQKSTGPKTIAGKRRSRNNALRHGYNTAPCPFATLDHLRRILSNPNADVASSLQTEVGRAAVALAVAEARLDRILEDRSTLQVIDKNHASEAERMAEAMPRHRRRNKEEAWMKEALTFLLKCNHRSRRMFKLQFNQQARYLAQAHATRRKALMHFLAATDQKSQKEANL
jgi:hypothetical protein